MVKCERSCNRSISIPAAAGIRGQPPEHSAKLLGCIASKVRFPESLRSYVQSSNEIDAVGGDGAPIPRWVARKTRKMCKEGAELFLAWYVAALPLGHDKIEHQSHYEEVKVEARELSMWHNRNCDVCCPARLPMLTRLNNIFVRATNRSQLVRLVRDVARRLARS